MLKFEFHYFVNNFLLVIDVNDLSKVSVYPCLSPEAFKNLKNCLPISYDVFLAHCLVKSWKETDLWSAANFEEMVSMINTQLNSNNIEILNILSQLTTDSRLTPFLTTHLLNQSLDTLNQHNQELKSLNELVLPWIRRLESKERERNESLLGSSTCISNKLCSSNKVVINKHTTVITNNSRGVDTDSLSEDSSFKCLRQEDSNKEHTDVQKRLSKSNSPCQTSSKPSVNSVCPRGGGRGSKRGRRRGRVVLLL
ncbi:hypothetical protein GEMRC1_001031 [Eukaryota sp. GEM-RC1]